MIFSLKVTFIKKSKINSSSLSHGMGNLISLSEADAILVQYEAGAGKFEEDSDEPEPVDPYMKLIQEYKVNGRLPQLIRDLNRDTPLGGRARAAIAASRSKANASVGIDEPFDEEGERKSRLSQIDADRRRSSTPAPPTTRLSAMRLVPGVTTDPFCNDCWSFIDEGL